MTQGFKAAAYKAEKTGLPKRDGGVVAWPSLLTPR